MFTTRKGLRFHLSCWFALVRVEEWNGKKSDSIGVVQEMLEESRATDPDVPCPSVTTMTTVSSSRGRGLTWTVGAEVTDQADPRMK